MMPLRYPAVEPGKTLLLDENFQVYTQVPKEREMVGAWNNISYTKGIVFAVCVTLLITFHRNVPPFEPTQITRHLRKLKTW